MKRLILISIFLAFTFLEIDAQFYLSNAEQLFITSGESLNYDGITLTPSSDFTMTNTTITKNTTLVHSSVNSHIERIYAFSNVVTGFTGTARIDYLNEELNSIPEANLQMSIHNGSGWQAINTLQADATNNFVVCNAISNMSLSEMTLISALSVLPVRWLSFTGNLFGVNAILKWSTAIENNSKEFIIEHSTEESMWKVIGRVKAKGMSSSISTYSFIHTTPSDGNNFYRLIEVDNDGKTSKTQIVNIANANKTLPPHAYPNPVINGFINVRLQQHSLVRVLKSTGEMIISKQLNAGVQRLDLQHLPAGIYRLVASNHTINFIKL
jgi:hypothetical protein